MANGAVPVIEGLARKGDPYPIHQPIQVFRSEAGKRFIEVTDLAGKDLVRSEVSLGAAFGDVDNDGDTDILVINNNGPFRLLRNNVGQRRKWLGLRLIDAESKPDLLGTRVVLKREGMPTLWRRVRTDGSFCSAHDHRVLFGLGENDLVTSVENFWPDGTREIWQKPVPMRYTTLRRGFVNRENGQ